MKPPLLLVGHGTRDDAGAQEFIRFVDRMRARLGEAAGGFIELSRPPLREAVASLVAGGHGRVAAVPLVLVSAGHAKGDIPGALARERERHPGFSYAYGRPLGPHPGLLAALAERLAAAAPEPGGDTAVLLVGRGSTDPDANSEVHKVARLLWETHAAAFMTVETAFVSLTAPGVPAGLERCGRLGARRVVVLPYFLFRGVLPDRVAGQARAWAAEHPEVGVRCAEVVGDCEALADVVTDRYHEALSSDIRMNCDMCVYRVAMPGHADRVGAPQRPHHHPDDPAHHGHAHVH
jgi:sirohydrochlorin cobaltochelatase